MTQSLTPPTPSQDEPPTELRNAPDSRAGSRLPTPEKASDNDTSEKPVVEKLKHTSIAPNSQYTEIIENDNFAPRRSPSETNSTALDTTSGRGRPVKKRSFDDLESAGAYRDAAPGKEGQHEGTNGHARKRSRDIRVSEPTKVDKQVYVVGTAVEEESEGSPTPANVLESRTFERKEENSDFGLPLSAGRTKGATQDQNQEDHTTSTKAQSTGADKAPEDRDMQDLTAIPRKKRSRDQLDSEADRDQKILATDEARAQRRSDEIERTDAMAASKIDSPPATHSADSQSQTSAVAFASSGFAAHASSNISPFGALGATNSPFTLSTTSASSKVDPPEPSQTEKPKSTASGGFSSFANTTATDSGAKKMSPFATSSLSNGGVFGASVFGSGFGSGFGTGTKLTSFAAPLGDAKLGHANGGLKPIGSPSHGGSIDEDEDGNSDGEGAGFGEEAAEGRDEVEDKFYHQDVQTGEDDEVTEFSARASLYSFKDKAWKEAGKGTFKFNTSVPPENDVDSPPTSGRFIMRAHQTFRVLLNAPVLKKMTVGDGRGKEPSGKSFSFGVIEHGTLVPYLLKLSDTTDSRALYNQVRRLQENMPEL